jgi:hypothetical protein
MKKLFVGNLDVGKYIEGIGLLGFVATFWINAGIVIGGNPYFWGHFLPTAEVIFPFSALALLLVWIGRKLQNSLRTISTQEIVFWGCFYALSLGITLLSDYKFLSLPWLLIWVMAWFVFQLKDSIFPNTWLKQGILWMSISIGAMACFWLPELFPHTEISKDLIGMAAVCGIFFSSSFGNGISKFFLHVFYAYIALKTENPGIIIAAGIALFNVQKYLPRMKFRALIFWGPMMFWGGGFGFLLSQGLNWNIGTWFNFVSVFVGNLKLLLFGAGEGQFLHVLDLFSAKIINPTNIAFPPSGVLIAFFEKGILGILLFAGLFFYQKLFWIQEKTTILPFLALCAWIFSPDIVLLETGVVFLLAMLSVRNRENSSAEKE